MTNLPGELVIHRAVERQAARRSGIAAIVDGVRTINYGELNGRANIVARRLIAAGLRRGQVTVACMERSADVAIVLLAVLKSGAVYSWIDASHADAELPRGVAIVHPNSQRSPHVWLDLSHALSQPVRHASPNLPIVARASDIACALPANGATPTIFIPHAAIAGLRITFPRAQWGTDPAAMDLWAALMAGATVTLVYERATAAA